MPVWLVYTVGCACHVVNAYAVGCGCQRGSYVQPVTDASMVTVYSWLLMAVWLLCIQSVSDATVFTVCSWLRMPVWLLYTVDCGFHCGYSIQLIVPG